MKAVVIVGVATLALVAALGATARDSERMMVGYETSLTGRTGAQRHNSVLAALRIDGSVIEPGEVFSFNQTVGTFSRDAGYRRAPVSYNGDLIKDWGGGVCQTSTTLYNAALLAGFPILERFHHRTAPSYVPAGRDAAVAYPGIDLRFRNDLLEPVRLHTFVEGNHLRVEIWTKSAIQRRAEIVTRVLARRRPTVLRLALGPHSQGVRATGREGFEVSVYRRLDGKEAFISHDSYPSMDTLIGVPE